MGQFLNYAKLSRKMLANSQSLAQYAVELILHHVVIKVLINKLVTQANLILNLAFQVRLTIKKVLII